MKNQSTIVTEKTKASQEAERLGLDYMSFGRYGKKGKVTHISDKGRLVKVDKPTQVTKLHSDKTVMAKRIGPQKGSNPGGMFVGVDGVKRYVKKYRNPVQAQGENIANAVYNALGIGAPKSLVYQDDKGRMTFASEIIPNTNILGYDIDREEAKSVLKGFAADVLMANWDAVGLEFDNIVFQKGNKNPIRIDNGAAFLTRAQGEYKPSNLLDKVTEYENFQDKNINPTYSQIFKKAAYTKKEWQKEFKKQVADIIKTRKKFGDWTKFVSQFPAQTPQIKKANIAVGKMLEIRTNKLAKLAQKM